MDQSPTLDAAALDETEETAHHDPSTDDTAVDPPVDELVDPSSPEVEFVDGAFEVEFVEDVASSTPVVHAGCLLGIDAQPVEVEVRVAVGLPEFEIGGLPQRHAREARLRVKSAIGAQGFRMPKRNLVCNLAPGSAVKTGSSFDLAIATGILAVIGTVDEHALTDTLLLGELSLGGQLRSIRGVLPHLRSALQRGLKRAIVPAGNETEAALVRDLDVRVARDLRDVVAHLNDEAPLPPPRPRPKARHVPSVDLAEVRGQGAVRRALEIAAAGGHHVLMIGPPGAGKTMLARRLSTILPSPSETEALEIATIASAAGIRPPADLGSTERPFRAPHHTASAAAMVGGGQPIRPGEVTLAHRGVLFLDELPEFRRDVVETLRTTMTTGQVHIARALAHVRMPAAPLMVAAMNPCPCGYAGDPERLCTCSAPQIERYRSRISGPLVDRFDLHVVVPRVAARHLRRRDRGETSAVVRERVTAARARQTDAPDTLESLMAQTAESALAMLDHAVDALGLSARAYVKALRIARTIANLEAASRIDEAHVGEAIQYRILDRRQLRS